MPQTEALIGRYLTLNDEPATSAVASMSSRSSARVRERQARYTSITAAIPVSFFKTPELAHEEEELQKTSSVATMTWLDEIKSGQSAIANSTAICCLLHYASGDRTAEGGGI
jgi:hypothetical protein